MGVPNLCVEFKKCHCRLFIPMPHVNLKKMALGGFNRFWRSTESYPLALTRVCAANSVTSVKPEWNPTIFLYFQSPCGILLSFMSPVKSVSLCLLPTGIEQMDVLGIGSIPVAILRVKI